MFHPRSTKKHFYTRTMQYKTCNFSQVWKTTSNPSYFLRNESKIIDEFLHALSLSFLFHALTVELTAQIVKNASVRQAKKFHLTMWNDFPNILFMTSLL